MPPRSFESIPSPAPQPTPSIEHGATPERPQYEESRQEAIDAYAQPYHMHFAEQAEGEKINPELAELNFDTLITLTAALHSIHETSGGRAQADAQTIYKRTGWYLEKYSNISIMNPQTFINPARVVQLWIQQLGPQNDMFEAGPDLRIASDILDETIENRLKYAEVTEFTDSILSIRESSVTLDLEIARLPDTPPGEALKHLQRAETSTRKLMEAGEVRHGCEPVDMMNLATIRIEKARLEQFGTLSLAKTNDPERVATFEKTVASELASLDTTLLNNLDFVEEQTRDATAFPPKNIFPARLTSNLFEATLYSLMLHDSLDKGVAVTTRISPATRREESSETHISYDSDGSFLNTNFDMSRTSLADGENGESSLYSTEYFQAKLLPKKVKLEDEKAINTELLGGKSYFYVAAEDIVGVDSNVRGRPDMLRFIHEFAVKTKQVLAEQSQKT